MNSKFSKSFQSAIDKAQKDDDKKKAQKILDQAQEGWKDLAGAVTKGILNYINSNLEITIKSKTEIPDPATQQHEIIIPSEHIELSTVKSNKE